MLNKFFHKFFIAVLVLSFILTFSQSVFASSFDAKTLSNFKVVNTFSANQYTDVPSSSTFYENVKTGYEYGIMQGYGETFGVKNDITRLASIIIASRIHSIYNYGTNLADTQFLGTARERYLAYAKKYAIFSTFDDYDVPATRAEFVAILSSSLPDDAFSDINEVEYGRIPDVSVLSQYAGDIYRFYRAGIVVGSDEKGTFYPDSYISRGAACAIATRMVNPDLRKTILSRRINLEFHKGSDKIRLWKRNGKPTREERGQKDNTKSVRASYECFGTAKADRKLPNCWA